MKIFVKVKANARDERVELEGQNHFKVFVKALPVEGKANAAVISAVAKYFKVPQAEVKIISGAASRNKVIKISE